MRIAFLINDLRYRGAQRVLVDDANMFARAGAQVLLCTLYPQADTPTIARELDARVEHIVLEARGPFDLRAVARCAELLKSRGINALITTLNDGNIMGRWVALASSSRLRLFRRESNTPRRKVFWQRALDVLFDGLTYRILAVTEDVRRDLVKLSPWRASKVIVLHNAAPAPTHVTRPNRADPRILTVGRMTAQKDQSTLIDALGILASKGHAFSAHLVGDGELYGALRDRTTEKGISERVTFSRLLSHEDVLREYRESDIFVLSSQWEGCPNVVIEAMANGVPVVASAVGGVPELVENGISGILVPPGNPSALADALAHLTSDHGLRMAMGSAARRRARCFAPAERFEQLYRMVTEG